MTKLRPAFSIERAIDVIAARIGYDRCASICTVSERAVRHWSDPDGKTSIPIDKARLLDAAYIADGGEFAPIASAYNVGITITQTVKAKDLLDTAQAIMLGAAMASAEIIEFSRNPANLGTCRKARAFLEDLANNVNSAAAALEDTGG